MTYSPTFPLTQGTSIWAIPQGNAQYEYGKNTILRFDTDKIARKYFYVSNGPNRTYKFELDTFRLADRCDLNQDFLLFPSFEEAKQYLNNEKRMAAIRSFFSSWKKLPVECVEPIYNILIEAEAITPIKEQE